MMEQPLLSTPYIRIERRINTVRTGFRTLAENIRANTINLCRYILDMAIARCLAMLFVAMCGALCTM